MANPIGPDISFYQDNPNTARHIDFVKMAGVADYVLIRAGQNVWPDHDFAYNWYYARQAGLPRGSYWYYDSRVSPKSQAELWVKTLNRDLGELPLFADFEEKLGGYYTGWQYAKEFMDWLKVLAHGKALGIYTGYYYWRDYMKVPAEEQEYFGQFPLWIAHYGVTNPWIPSPWTNHLFHQYTESGPGSTYGVESTGIDLNRFNGTLDTFKSMFSYPVPIPEIPTRLEVHIEVYPGVMYHEIYRHGSWCYILVIKPGVAHYEVTKFSQKIVSQVQRETGAQFVVNGGAYDASGAIGLHVSNGAFYRLQDEFEPSANASRDDVFEINKWDKWGKSYNALAGKRLIVENGLVSTQTSAAWRELHPRTLVGVKADGSSVWCVVDGRQPGYSRGIDLYESADIMIEMGCVRAIDEDGGGSSTLNHNGQTKNIPIDQNIPGKERPVGTHNVIYIEAGTGEVPPDEGDNDMTDPAGFQITTVGLVLNSAIRVNVKSASGGTTIHEYLYPGDKVYGYTTSNRSDIFYTRIYRKDGNIVVPTTGGPIWKSVTGYIRMDPEISYPGTTPPPEPPPTNHVVTLKDFQYNSANGNASWKAVFDIDGIEYIFTG